MSSLDGLGVDSRVESGDPRFPTSSCSSVPRLSSQVSFRLLIILSVVAANLIVLNTVYALKAQISIHSPTVLPWIPDGETCSLHLAIL